MDCKYVLVRDTYSDDAGTHEGYGIALVDCESVTISAAHDLSCSESEVADLVKMCNRLKISPVHFQDVVDDFLT